MTRMAKRMIDMREQMLSMRYIFGDDGDGPCRTVNGRHEAHLTVCMIQSVRCTSCRPIVYGAARAEAEAWPFIETWTLGLCCCTGFASRGWLVTRRF